MEEIMEIVNEYNKLHEQYQFLNISNPMPEHWADLTAEEIRGMVSDAQWLADVAQKFADKLSEMEAAITPVGTHYRENEVNTIDGYKAQGFTVEEAPKAQMYDILWNKWVNGYATANEVAQMEAIAEELGL